MLALLTRSFGATACVVGGVGASGEQAPRCPASNHQSPTRHRRRAARHPHLTAHEATGLNPAAAGGLVICAENVRDSVDDGIATGELRAIDALRLRFPSPEMVTAAAALFEAAAPWASSPPLVRRVARSSRNPDGLASLPVLAWYDSAGPILSGPKRPPSGR